MTVQPDENGNWPSVEDWPSIQADVVCRTPGCRAEGQTYRLTLFENVEPPIYRAQCAGCGNNITDITEVAPDA